MPDAGLNLAAILGSTNGFSRKALAAIQSADSIRLLAKPVAFPDSATLWAHATGRVATELAGILESLQVANVIASGWNTYHELAQYTDPAKYPPAEKVTCVLGRHSMDIAHEASVDILINGAPSGTVVFDITLHIDLEGAILTIQDGRIIAAKPVQCKLGGELKLGKAQLLEKELGEFDAGSFAFPGGIAIRAHDSAGAVA